MSGSPSPAYYEAKHSSRIRRWAQEVNRVGVQAASRSCQGWMPEEAVSECCMLLSNSVSIQRHGCLLLKISTSSYHEQAPAAPGLGKLQPWHIKGHPVSGHVCCCPFPAYGIGIRDIGKQSLAGLDISAFGTLCCANLQSVLPGSLAYTHCNFDLCACPASGTLGTCRNCPSN